MKQVFQSLKNGTPQFRKFHPTCKDGHVVVASNVGLVSAGTERMLIDFGKSNVLKRLSLNLTKSGM